MDLETTAEQVKSDSTIESVEPWVIKESEIAKEAGSVALNGANTETIDITDNSEPEFITTTNTKANKTVATKPPAKKSYQTAKGSSRRQPRGNDRAPEEEDLIRLYLEDIGRHPLLTKDDEIRLSKVVQAGLAAETKLNTNDQLKPTERRKLRREIRAGEEAHRQFVSSNLRLVVSIAKRYQKSGLPLLDLVQEGNLGLMHAVDKFDWRKGFKFSTYATWWVKQAITRGIANTGRNIRLPVHAGDLLRSVQKIRVLLEDEYGRSPTIEEIAHELKQPVRKIEEVLRYPFDPLSLSTPIKKDSDIKLGDNQADRTAVDPFEAALIALLPAQIAKLLSVLDERERIVVALRFGLDTGEVRTLQEVGDKFGLTRERIRQIEVRAMVKLRHPSNDTGARELIN